MDANLPLQTASFPWLSLIVLLPAAAALLMPLLPGDGSDPKWPRTIALAVLLADLVLMLVAFSQHFDGAESGLQLVERVSWVPALRLEWSLAADGLSAPLVVLSGFKPRLPWFVYRFTQAVAHAVVMRSFGRWLRAARPAPALQA